MTDDRPTLIARGRARGGLRRLAILALALMPATLWLGCSVEKNYKILSFFFDGVPDPNAPVPLVTLAEGWALHRGAVSAFSRAQRSFEVVFIGQSKTSLVEAVRHGMGVAAISRRRADIPGIAIWEDAPLPPLTPLHCGIYLSESADRQLLERLADTIFNIIGPQPESTEAQASVDAMVPI